MKWASRLSHWTVLTSWVVATAFGSLARSADLEKSFWRPPPEARPWVYWMWMDGNVSSKGITADLEAMQHAGIGGVILMEVDVGIPKGPVKFMSDEWRQLFKHVVTEAERLGLQVTLNAGPGWTGSGGPWVKPEQSMQHIVASAVEINGPTNFNTMLPRPTPRPPYFGTNGLPAELLKEHAEFYRDVAVLAFPTPMGNERIDDIEHKALYVRDPFSSMPGAKPFIPAPAEFPASATAAAIRLDKTLDLTERLDAEGRLNWNAPPGTWTILRFGRTSTGANTRPAPSAGLGLECDKFNKQALDVHFNHFVGALLREVKPDMRHKVGWTSLHMDSWEMGAQNWTADIRDEFRKRRGYDPLHYLPAATGWIVDSREVSERFLWDLRQTAQELVIENYAQHLKALGRKYGFGLSIEPYDMNPTADLNLGAVADVPMCEFWSSGFDTSYSCFEAASVAHTGGKSIVAAEAFTAGDRERWQFYPGSLKSLGDWAFCSGVNRIVFHRYAHQPWLDRWPGMTMGPYGVHWERTQTWWEMSGAYHRYLARCQFMLQQGVAVADILYLTPEGAPQAFKPPRSALQIGLPDHREYNFDACSPETLIARAAVKHGQIVFSGGTSYRLLALPNVNTMTPKLLRKVKDLIRAGATVVGAPPRKSPSLSAYPKCDDQVRELAREIWGDGVMEERSDWQNPTSGPPIHQSNALFLHRRLGKGRVIWGGELTRRVYGAQIKKSALQGAEWIWFDEGNASAAAPVGMRYFRRVFMLPPDKVVESARIAVTADNEFEVWVNGRSSGSGGNFMRVYAFDVLPFLKPGRNIVALKAINRGDSPNPAGLIASLTVCSAGNRTLKVETDRHWQAAASVSKDWRSDDGSVEGWRPAKELGEWSMSPWGRVGELECEPEIYPDYARLAALLRTEGVSPDFESDGPLRYTHRRDGRTDIYFVANRSTGVVTMTAHFRVTGREPELWRPLTGEICRAQIWEERDGQTFVPLKLDACDSLFVVFRKSAKAPANKAGRNWGEFETAEEIRGSWEVRFQTGRGAPEKLTFDTLVDWSQHNHPGVKFFSGIAIYRKTFVWNPTDSPRSDFNPKLFLDLGRVEVMANVKLNGEELGTLWKFPFRVDVTGVLRPGENQLEIEVANLWPNRLIGDASLPKEERVAWTTWNPFSKGALLLPSGLFGPVQLQVAKTNNLQSPTRSVNHSR